MYVSGTPAEKRDKNVEAYIPQRRVLVLVAVFVVLFGVVGVRLTQLQWVENRKYQAFLDRHIHKVEQIQPSRGRILDHRGQVLAEDRPHFEIWIQPAERRRDANRRWVTASLLTPLDTESLLQLGRADAGRRAFYFNLAAERLAAGNPMVARLAELLAAAPDAADSSGLAPWRDEPAQTAPPSEDALAVWRLRIARDALGAFLARRADETADLLTPRPWLTAVSDAVFAEMLRRADDPEGDEAFHAVRPRMGRKRVYPQGAAVAHIVGYTSELDMEEYARLRGRWPDDGRMEPEPGEGVLRRRQQEYFSIKPESASSGGADANSGVAPNPEGHPADVGEGERERTDEERILALYSRRRDGRMERVTGYLLDNRVGRAGVEAYYNQRLRGRHLLQPLHRTRLEPDEPPVWAPFGPRVKPQNGEDLTLTIDLNLQKRVREELLRVVRELSAKPENANFPIAATAILMNPNDGALHAMVSVPDYDPARLSADWKTLNADPAKPMLYHAIAQHFQPGSVLKPFVAFGALEEGVIGPHDTVNCTGEVRLADGSRYRCMARTGHGELDVKHALMVSCNPMFYELGRRLRSRKLVEWLGRFGFGRPTGIDLWGEAPGQLPVRQVTRRGGLPTGEVFYLSTGQGLIAVTPLQMAVAYAALANAEAGGDTRIVRPHVVQPKPGLPPAPTAKFLVTREDLAVIRQGLWMVVQGSEGRLGTGALSRMPITPGGYPIMEIAGKTGSAEVDAFYGGALYKKKASHAWYCGYAPAGDGEKPKVVIVVLVEYGDLGGMVSAPLARKLLQIFFDLEDEVDYANDLPALG